MKNERTSNPKQALKIHSLMQYIELNFEYVLDSMRRFSAAAINDLAREDFIMYFALEFVLVFLVDCRACPQTKKPKKTK